jgi:hypothetical protein
LLSFSEKAAASLHFSRERSTRVSASGEGLQAG